MAKENVTLTLNEAAEKYAGTLKLSALRYLIKTGKIRAVKSGKKFLIEESEITNYLSAKSSGSASSAKKALKQRKTRVPRAKSQRNSAPQTSESSEGYDELLTLGQIVEKFDGRITMEKLRYLVRKKQIEFVKQGIKVLITEDAINEYLATPVKRGRAASAAVKKQAEVAVAKSEKATARKNVREIVEEVSEQASNLQDISQHNEAAFFLALSRDVKRIADALDKLAQK
ncbi:hypothetical protein FACS189499_09420 [Clostridia bacterium]|nr:hypothetical protein FACS189499_09420 [Clostridia bacterium]